MAKQPYYHRIDGLLFTATEVVTEEQIIAAIQRIYEVVEGTVEIEPGGFSEPESGDPADL